MSTITFFTDGSAKGNGKLQATGGIGIYNPENLFPDVSLETRKAIKILDLKFTPKKITNNISELTAILFAMNLAKDHLKAGERILIKTDSMYSINSLSKWWKKWELNDWTNSKGVEVLNKELITTIILDYIKIFPKQILFEHIRAHTKEMSVKDAILYPKKYLDWFGNNKADLLATNYN